MLYVSSVRPSSTKSEFSLVVAEYQRRLIAQQCMADQCQTFIVSRTFCSSIIEEKFRKPTRDSAIPCYSTS